MKKKILDLLQELGVDYRYEEHKAVFTVEESLSLLDKQIPTKNLLLQDKTKRTILVIMHGLTRLDTKILANELDTKKLTFAQPEVLMEKLGVTPGSVSVFGLLNAEARDIEVVLDSNILVDELVSFHPNINTASIFFRGTELERIVRTAGHHPVILDLSSS